MPQPTLQIARAVWLTVGGICNGERWEIVIPVATDDATMGHEVLCQDAIQSFDAAGASPMKLLRDCMSDEVDIRFVQAVGILSGYIPARRDYLAGSKRGNRPGNALPMQVCNIVSYYADPLQLAFGDRMRVAKTLIPGIDQNDVQENVVTVNQLARLDSFGGTMKTGWTSTTNILKSWYRILNGLDEHGTGHAWNCFVERSRSYVGTVKRRLLPH